MARDKIWIVLTAEELLNAFDTRVRPATIASSGFAELEALSGGMVPGRVWMVVGEPGQGRTTLPTQWAAGIGSQRGQAVHLVTPCESREVVVARLLASTGRLSMHDLSAQAEV